MAFLSEWLYRQKLTIKGEDIGSNLSNFPVLITLNSTNFDFSKAKSDGSDIRFTLADGTTLISFEREIHGTSEAFYWVKVPSISSSSDTEIYIYYGNSTATDAENASDVWDSSYKLILHPNSSSFLDSTDNDNDGTALGNVTVSSTGTPIGLNKIILDGTDDLIRLENSSDFNFGTGDFHIRTYMTLNDLSSNQNILAYSTSAGAIQFFFSANNWRVWGATSIVLATSGLPTLNTGQRYLVEYVRNGNNWQIYVDKVSYASVTDARSLGSPNHVRKVALGAEVTSALYSQFLNGSLDEYRISKGTYRTRDWISVSQLSESNSLVDFGTEENINKIILSDEVIIHLSESDTDSIVLDDSIEVKNALSQLNDDNFILSDNISISKSENINIEETIYLGEKQELVGVDSFILSEDSEVHLIAPVHFATKIISYNPLVIVTDTNPIHIVKIDVSDPVNPSWASYFVDLPGETAHNAKDVSYNSVFGYLYIVCENGQVIKVDTNDYDLREQIDTGDTDDLLKITGLEETHRLFIGTEDTTGEIIVLDHFDVEILNMDFRFLESITETFQTTINLTHASLVNTDFRFLQNVKSQFQTDFRFLYVEDNVGNPLPEPFDQVPIYAINRTDFEVYINNVLMNDVQLESIKIRHSVDEKSDASFILARKHDNLDYTEENISSQITNQNAVKIYIKGHLEIEGNIARLDCDSEGENVLVTVEASEKDSKASQKISLPMSSLNENLHPYQVLLHSPSIYNPIIDPDDDSPPYYKGISVDLGIATYQNVLRYRMLTDYPAGNSTGFGYNSEGLYSAYPNLKEYLNRNTGFGLSIGTTAIEIMNGSFQPRQNWTYFFGSVTANNYILKPEEENVIQNERLSTAFYVGTSMSVYSTDTWDLLQVRYRYQRVLDDQIEDRISVIGAGTVVHIETTPTDENGNIYSDYEKTYRSEYRIGEAPFKEIATNNGVLSVRPRWEDRNDGLYQVTDEGYDYRDYARQIADIEYEKLKRTHGEILPDTSANIELMLDGYYFYNPSLLTRINVVNTTTTGIYKDSIVTGFPTSIKAIEISASNMKVILVTNNSLSTSELEELDELYPDPNDFITQEEIKFLVQKSNPNTNQLVK